MKKCLIIGGGVIGLCSAYYLQKEGYEVTVIDQSQMDQGASYVNAGFISPSHIIPLAAPGVIKKGLKWMFDPSSPFYIKPRMDLDFFKWVWAFNNSCNERHVKKSLKVIKDISLLSADLYEDLKSEEGFKYHHEKKGLMMYYQTDKMMEEEARVSQLAREIGLDAVDLDQKEVKSMESEVKLKIKGATLYKCDSHTTPLELMTNLKEHLIKSGVKIIYGQKVNHFLIDKGQLISVHTSQEKFKADEFVLAAGSWTGELCRQMGIPMLLEAGKGYCINVYRSTKISYPAILTEAKAAVTPMNGFTRFAGTMEISGVNESVNKVRVEAIARSANRYFPEIEITDEEKERALAGLRPLSADGLPYIGKSAKCKNLILATGHAMLGWTMGPGTGKLVSEIASGRQLSMDIIPFHPDRKF